MTGAAVKKIQQGCGKIPKAPVAKRPHRRPLDLRRRIEDRRDQMFVTRRVLKRLPELSVAEELDIIRTNGVPFRKVREAPQPPDFVPLKNPGIALDCLHEGARFALFGGAALAEAAAAQPRSELVDAQCRRGKIVLGI